MIGYIPLLVAGPTNIWRGIQRQTVLANICTRTGLKPITRRVTSKLAGCYIITSFCNVITALFYIVNRHQKSKKIVHMSRENILLSVTDNRQTRPTTKMWACPHSDANH